MTRIHLVLLSALLALALAACGGDSGEGSPGAGTVLEVDAAAGEVTLEHGDIPDLMKAMTMTFEVADPALLAGVEPGDRVDFRVRYADGTYTVIELQPK